MSEYYSTQTTIEDRVRAARITVWGDRDDDGSLDPEALTQALVRAKNDILSFVQQRYGSAVTDEWDSDTVPPLIGAISDELTIWHLNSGTNAAHPVVKENKDRAIETLKQIRDYELAIPDIDFVSGQENETIRMRYLECTDSEVEAGYCNPDAYEYI